MLASQRTPNTAKNSPNLMVRDGLEYVPNVAHVFRQDQHLYFLYEVYDAVDQGEERCRTGSRTRPRAS
jgi:hypothetical protein